ncbi:xanthine phosphoribosyltransferase [Streptococcus pyogenes]
MSEESKEVEVTKESQTLGLNEAKSMTVGEAVRKESEIKAGVTENDSILDKYIKQHRDEVSSQKFDAKYTELDTASLDNFIKKQREELSKAGLVDDEPVSAESAEQDSTLVEEVAEDLAPMETTAVVTGIPVEATVPVLDLDPSERVIPEPQMTKEEPKRDQFLSEDSHHPAKQNTKKGWLIALFLLLLAILSVVFGWNHFLRQDSGKTTQTASKQTKTSLQTDSAKKATRLKAAAKAFEKQYGTFYTDATKSKLKNSAFATLPDLEAALKALEGSAYYDKAKAKVDSLKKAIAAITAVNGKFVSDAVVDGEKVSAEVKADANFDNLSSATLTTGNANLDAVYAAEAMDVPMIFAKKHKNITMTEGILTAEVYSFTKQVTSTVSIAGKFLSKEDKVLIIDDFLANGQAAKGLIEIIGQAGAQVVGVGIVIEKSFQDGRRLIEDMVIEVTSLARIKNFENGNLNFLEADA